jgi:hypothetical protein
VLRQFFFLLLLFAAFASFPGSSLAQLPSPGQAPGRQPDEQESKMQREQAKKLNKERQEALKRDTDKLLKLSAELKQYVDKSNEHVLSLDVIKKAEEIEKLAHSVKEKMKGY